MVSLSRCVYNKIMKKRLIVPLAAMIIICTSALTACSWLFEDNWLTKDPKESTDAAMQRLCAAVEARDADAVKAEFSYVDVCDVEGFDESVEKLLDYITGDDVRYRRISSGYGEGTAFGSQQPNWRYFPSCRYDIITNTDEYKVVFGFYAYYSDVRDKPNKQKMGFNYFDIINKKNDRPNITNDENFDFGYTGCPMRTHGINFDYVTKYFDIEDKKALCDRVEDFDPVVFNGVSDIADFTASYGDEYSLGSREDGMGFADVTAGYDDEFFESHSLMVAGASYGECGYGYTPQYGMYIGDFIMNEICVWEYDDDDGDDPERFAKGVIIVWELPVKVPTDIEVNLVRTISPLIEVEE